jgi:hypothetical protein
MSRSRNPLEQIEFMRNVLAFGLVSSFVGAMIAFTFYVIPDSNKDILTYMVGQLSGMATMALGFYFVNKVGQDALDAKRTENTGKLADAVVTAVNSTAAPEQKLERATERVVEGAEQARDEVLGTQRGGVHEGK